jgi:hypothetical protein
MKEQEESKILWIKKHSRNTSREAATDSKGSVKMH